MIASFEVEVKGEKRNVFDVKLVELLSDPRGDGHGILLTIVVHAIVQQVPRCCCFRDIPSI